MVVVTFELVRAKKGDCLLLHYGDPDSPRLSIIDGGPPGVFKSFLKPRLEDLRKERGQKLLVDLMMVSHIDSDHIAGLVELTNLLKRQQGQEDLLLDALVVWHNSFGDVFGEAGASVAAPEGGDVSESAVAAFGADLGIGSAGSLVLLSVGQGQSLRNNVTALGWNLNSPFPEGGLVVAGTEGSVVSMPGGMTITVLGPDPARLHEFREHWDKELMKEKDKAKTAAYVDDSAPNLASIVGVVEVEKCRILLTGDGRGDDIMSNAEAAGLLDGNDQLWLDLLKVPHHGSDRNVDVGFFRTFPADHYVISGNGEHGNPDLKTFQMIFEARKDDIRKFTIHLTYDPEEFEAETRPKKEPKPYPVAELSQLLADHKAAGRDFAVEFPKPEALSLPIDLA